MDAPRLDGDRRVALCIALGFAAFKAAQSALYSTGMFTSDTTTVLIAGLDFSMVSALFVIATEALIVAGALLGRLPAFSMPVVVPSVILAATATLSYGGVLDAVDARLSLLIVTATQGIATVLLTLAWAELLTNLSTTASMKTLAASMLLASVATFAMQRLPSTAALPCILVLLMVGVALFVRAKRTVARCSGPAPTRAERPSLRRHLSGLLSIGEGMLSLLVLGCTVGIINGFMVAQGYNFAGSAAASALGTVVASAAFFVMAYAFPRTFSAAKAYRALFPLLTATLIVWPFTNFQYGYFVGAAFVAGHSLISTSVMYLIVREAHEARLNPYAFMGGAVLLIRLSSVLGLVAGALIADLDIQPSFKTMLVFCIALYLLSLALLLMLRVRKKQEAPSAADLGAPPGAPIVPATSFASTQDPFAEQAALIAARGGLTQREYDILALLARGRSSTYIGQALYLSPNTVRGHIKNIYAKLSVHSKQEIIDLFSE